MITHQPFPVFHEFRDFKQPKDKKFTFNKKPYDVELTLYNTTLKDKYNQEIYFFDILELDGKLSSNTTNKKDYFICVWDANLGRIDFLYYEYGIQDFMWIDNICSYHFIRMINGVEILKDDEKRKKLKISKTIPSKVESIIDGTNEYFWKVD